MAIPQSLQKGLALPAICAPMFIVSNPDLVIAQCKGGLIGSFPVSYTHLTLPTNREV